MYVVTCNSPAQRDRWIERLVESLPSAPPVRAVVRPVPIEPLSQVVDQLVGTTGPVMVALSDDFFRDRADSDRLIAALNLERPRWPEHVRRPVVWWLAEYQVGRLIRGAPDYFDWQSGFFDFGGDADGGEQAYRSFEPIIVADADWGHTPVDVRRARIGELISRLNANRTTTDPVVWRVVAQWVHELGNHHEYLNEVAAAEDAFQREGELGQLLQDDTVIARAAGGVGRTQAMMGHLDAGEAWLRRALRLDRRLGRSQAVEADLANLGNVARAKGDLDGADDLFRQSALSADRSGDLAGRASALNNLAANSMIRGDLAVAGPMVEDALELYRQAGRSDGESAALSNLGVLAFRRGDLDTARRMHEAGLSIDRTTGRVAGEVSHLTALGVIDESRGDVEAARRWWRQALVRVSPYGVPAWSTHFERLLGRLPSP